MQNFNKGVQYSKDKLIKFINDNFNNSKSDDEQIIKVEKYISDIDRTEFIDNYEYADPIEDTFDSGINIFTKYFICIFLRVEEGTRPGKYVRFIDKITYVFDELFDISKFITKDKFDFTIDNYKKILMLK